MHYSTLIVLVLTIFGADTLATPDESENLKIRKIFEVDSCVFKLGITRSAKWEYKIHISKKIDGNWQLQNRYIRRTDFFKSYELKDWNRDGFTDVRIGFTDGNNAESNSYLFIYDSIAHTYRNIENFEHYSWGHGPEQAIAPGSPYYFSVAKMGCAGDMNQSHFFTVCNFKLIPLGYMIINYCDKPYNICIFKYDQAGNRKRIATIPMDYVDRNYERYTDYVSNYWIKHGLELINPDIE